jgi:hypothetical protein
MTRRSLRRTVALCLTLVLLCGCTRMVTIPTPPAIPAPPDITEQVKAIEASGIDQTQKVLLTQQALQTSKEQYAAQIKAILDAYNATLQRAQAAAGNIRSVTEQVLQYGMSIAAVVLGITNAAK